MFLVEPPPTQFDLHFSLLRFPVRVHPLFWLITAMMGMKLPPKLLLLWIPAVFLCIVLHELGHAVVMRFYGFDAAIVLYSFGGLAIPRPGRSGIRRHGPWEQIYISFAGPASGFILAALLALAVRAAGYSVHFMDDSWRDFVPRVAIPFNMQVTVREAYCLTFIDMVFEITVLWGVINLLPVFPLDGGQIAQQLFVLLDPHDAVRHALILSILVAIVIAFFAFVKWDQTYLAIFFLYLAYSSFTSLQSYRGY